MAEIPFLGRVLAVRETVDSLEEQFRQTDLELREQAEAEVQMLREESLAAAKLSLDDRGWLRLGTYGSDTTEFTAQEHRDISHIARAMTVTHPLIRRGVNLRIGYVWGSGCQITAPAADDDTQDLNAVVQAFLDDPSNRASIAGAQAREENERQLGTDGNVYFALFTELRGNGRVQVRSVHPDEIVDIITNPQDRDEPWYYKRQVQVRTTSSSPGAQPVTAMRTTWHPAMGYLPNQRARTDGDGNEILWDAPIKHVSVNRLNGWKYGLGDVYAALVWGRMYADFLTDWAKLMKSLSKLAWHASTKTSGRAGTIRDRMTTPEGEAGGTLVSTDNVKLEAVGKSGATLDSESGRPLAAMIAAGLDVPVTQLLTDPGVTGARATAETLDRPTYLAMNMRRSLWTEVLQDILGYVIDQAIRAPQGPLQGTTTVNPYTGRLEFQLAGEQDRNLEVKWPALDETDPLLLVDAIVKADATGHLPPQEIARLLLHAIGVEDVDAVMETMLDDEGNFKDPELERALADERRREQGQQDTATPPAE
jgi:hypothetical protein